MASAGPHGSGRHPGRKMNEIVSIIQNASPVMAAVIIGLVYSVRAQTKEIADLKKRIGEYDAMSISAQLAGIQKDLEWIKLKLAEKE